MMKDVEKIRNEKSEENARKLEDKFTSVFSAYDELEGKNYRMTESTRMCNDHKEILKLNYNDKTSQLTCELHKKLIKMQSQYEDNSNQQIGRAHV